MLYQIFSQNEWLYPDMPLATAPPQDIALHAAKNGHVGYQMLFDEPLSGLEITAKDMPEFITIKSYALVDIFVEKNTGPVSFCVKEGEDATPYTTRKAPFRVYDAAAPLTDAPLTRAYYISFAVNKNATPGEYSFELAYTAGSKTFTQKNNIRIYNAAVPEKETLHISNWFGTNQMAIQHNVEKWSEAHWEIIEKYARLMREVRQTHFLIPKEAFIVSKGENGRYIFDYTQVKRMIELFLSLGFTHIEGPLVFHRPDFWADHFIIDAADETYRALSDPGYDYACQYLQAWHDFLVENGWLSILHQHVGDEPIPECAHEYRILAGIIRKFLPGVPIMEAVEMSDLDGAVDIWIPKNSWYLEHQADFKRKRKNGDTLWFYTCCFPGGHYLNRLWDMPLIRTRLLHTGNYRYNMTGFLHWGLNFCDTDRDPFNQEEIFFPPGDTHVTYPGIHRQGNLSVTPNCPPTDLEVSGSVNSRSESNFPANKSLSYSSNPWGSMRLEMMRCGIEDYELLRELEKTNKPLADKIATRWLPAFNQANEDVTDFDLGRVELLEALEQTATFTTQCISPLVKIFADEKPQATAYNQTTALCGEKISYQVAYSGKGFYKGITVETKSEISEHIQLFQVGNVPCELPNYEDHDDYLLRTTPGLYPDVLHPLTTLSLLPNQNHSLWVYVNTAEIPAGTYEIETVFSHENKVMGRAFFTIEVLAAELAPQALIRTEWFYMDCLATYYNVEIFSAEHKQIVENYVAHYATHGMNMILTPIFSPALEMNVGGDRPTVQLVGVTQNGANYTFDFTLLTWFVDMCKQKGIKYFEFSHLYSQWGAAYAPKIFATVDGELKQIFGWHTAGNSAEYTNFVGQFLKAADEYIKANGLQDSVYLHISDEPGMWCIDTYKAASDAIKAANLSYPVLDALSDYEFYKHGLVNRPVSSTSHITDFLTHNVPNLWAYYCCAQYKDGLSNRFINMPGERTRFIGFQLYKYDMEGFLHWGYNHWYSGRSVIQDLDPYKVTDAAHCFQSGDAFLVYPGKDGHPVNSIRLLLVEQAMQDIRAAKTLEALAGREAVLEILDSHGDLTFTNYPRSPHALLAMREKINKAINERSNKNV